MKILIATGVYPPEAGGPAHYAKSLKEEFEKLGHTVTVRTFTVERRLPTGLRHLVYFLKTLPAYSSADWTLVLDTFSVCVPVAILRMFFGGVTVLRTGGDFLWEEYVERTKEKILLSDFYTAQHSFTIKERIIFSLTRWALSHMDRIVFSTAYQRAIWEAPYRISQNTVAILENAYPKVEPHPASGKEFVYCARRSLVWKNESIVREAFAEARRHAPDISLSFLSDLSHEEALERMQNAYAGILVSLGDISPNLALRAVSFGKPLILTKETGLAERLAGTALFVDPLDVRAITEKIVWLADEKNYEAQKKKAEHFSFVRSYEDIAREFLALITP